MVLDLRPRASLSERSESKTRTLGRTVHAEGARERSEAENLSLLFRP
jgi:hypothetical protein